MQEFITDLSLINNLISEQVLGWIKQTRPNNDDGLPFYAEYWVDSKGNSIHPVNFWRPSSDIKDCIEAIKYIKLKDEDLIEKVNTNFDSKYVLSEIETPKLCRLILEAAGIIVA